MSYAVLHFFQAGGTDALIVRVTPMQDAPHTQPTTTSLNSAGDDDGPISGMDIGLGATMETARKGLWAFEKAEHFNLMYLLIKPEGSRHDLWRLLSSCIRFGCRFRIRRLAHVEASHQLQCVIRGSTF